MHACYQSPVVQPNLKSLSVYSHFIAIPVLLDLSYVLLMYVVGTCIDVFIIFSLLTILSFLGLASVIVIRVFSLLRGLCPGWLCMRAFGIISLCFLVGLLISRFLVSGNLWCFGVCRLRLASFWSVCNVTRLVFFICGWRSLGLVDN